MQNGGLGKHTIFDQWLCMEEEHVGTGQGPSGRGSEIVVCTPVRLLGLNSLSASLGIENVSCWKAFPLKCGEGAENIPQGSDSLWLWFNFGACWTEIAV